jgi:hypothetical protein
MRSILIYNGGMSCSSASPESKRRLRMNGLTILGGSLVLVAVSLGWVLRR